MTLPPATNFNGRAATWDDDPVRTALARDIARAIQDAIPLSPTMDVLDFGCGTGLLSFTLLPFIRSLKGVDTSPGMIDVFRAKALQTTTAPVSAVLRNDPPSGPLPDHNHLICSAMALHHVQGIPDLLAQFYQALNPGGFCAVADLDPEGGLFHADPTGVFHNGFDRSALKQTFLEAGFVDVRTIDAARVHKPGKDGISRDFSVFLLTAVRP